MRTTVNLPDDVHEMAANLAFKRKISLGEAIAELVRRNQQPVKPAKQTRGEFKWPTFDVRPDAEPITLERTLELEDEW